MLVESKHAIHQTLTSAVYAMAIFSQVCVATENVPQGFELTTFATGFTEPIALATTPDGHVFVVEKSGKAWIVNDESSDPSLFVSIEVYSASECGLLGIALDPNYATNNYVYFFATITRDTQRIIRYTNQNGVGVNETTIRDGLPTSGQLHNGGGLRFGPDGKLYFSIGDTGQSELSQQIQTFAGKICRINSDGSTPDDNPFKTPTGTPRAIFALGFRNPFRFCFAPDSGLYVLDVGSNGEARREEINLVPIGSNGGWPLVEGVGQAEVEGELIQPLVVYGDQGGAITGGVIYDHKQFPSQYVGGMFHLDFVSNKMFFMSLGDDAGESHTEFMQAENGVVDIAIGPSGGLLYTELFTGNVKRLTFTSASTAIDENISDSDGIDVHEPVETILDCTNPLCGNGMAMMMLLMCTIMASLRKHGQQLRRI